MVGDTDNKMFAKGLYMSIIQKAFEELAIDTFFDEKRETLDFPSDTLTMPLPEGCFNIRNVYLLNGDDCNIDETLKVYWKRNYFTKGVGFVANDKGQNLYDPFYTHRGSYGNNRNSFNKTLIRAEPPTRVLHNFFYNIQAGNIMFSSSCRGKTNKVHIHYNGTGCAIDEVPIIPVFLRTAIEDYVIETVLRMRVAMESDRKWMGLWQIYEKRLNKEAQYGYGGSWQTAEYRIKTLNTSQRQELMEYLGKPASGSHY
jgi:hypothetical protein